MYNAEPCMLCGEWIGASAQVEESRLLLRALRQELYAVRRAVVLGVKRIEDMTGFRDDPEVQEWLGPALYEILNRSVISPISVRKDG